ncbi:hypothetical protein JKG47_10055 [Acidithiobacillus sp. MC6.1]|nr:hypothetical protein [Acidithiobacillus sp. MC6.1]
MSISLDQDLKTWRDLHDRAAPLLARLEKLQAEQKTLENRVKSVLAEQPDGSYEDNQSGVTVIHITRKGAVDWPKLAKDMGIAQEKMEAFRKASSKAFSFKASTTLVAAPAPTFVPVAAPVAVAAPVKKGRKPKATKEEVLPPEISTADVDIDQQEISFDGEHENQAVVQVPVQVPAPSPLQQGPVW